MRSGLCIADAFTCALLAAALRTTRGEEAVVGGGQDAL